MSSNTPVQRLGSAKRERPSSPPKKESVKKSKPGDNNDEVKTDLLFN